MNEKKEGRKRLIKNTQKATTSKWRQCKRFREKYREKKGRKGSMAKREIEIERDNKEME